MSETSWRGWHLHLPRPDVAATDRVVREVVGPAVDSLAALGGRPWFFVRYWQFGPHVRLRVADLDHPAAEALVCRLRAHLDQVLAGLGEALAPGEYRRWASPLAAAGEGGRALEAGDALPPGLYPSPYQPETDRYGGTALLATSERLFQTSSELALAFLRRQPPEAARCGLGLQATRGALALLDTTAARAAFCRRAGAAWDSWGARAGGSTSGRTGGGKGAERAVAATGGDAIPAPLRRWVADLGPAMAHWRRALGQARAEQILAAHIHMLHNRLGLTVAQERRHYQALTLAVAK